MVSKRKLIVYDARGRGNFDDVAFGFMQGWLHDGVSVPLIAERLNVARSTIATQRQFTAPPSERPNLYVAPRVTTAKVRAIARRRKLVKKFTLFEKTFVDKDCTTTRSTKVSRTVRPYSSPALVARKINTLTGASVSASTVRNDLHALGFSARKKPRGVFQQIEDPGLRVAFAKKFLKQKLATRSRYAWSDEKWFDSDDHGNQYEWCPKGVAPSQRARCQSPKKTHVWGVIGIGFRKLWFHPEKDPDVKTYGPGRPRKGELRPAKVSGRMKVDSAKHCNTCLAHALPALKKYKAILQQDGASVHTSKETREWLEERGIPSLTSWPPRSPDLNPIENMWAIVAPAVSARGPFDQKQLEKFVRQEFFRVPQSTVDALCLSVAGRCRRIVETGGVGSAQRRAVKASAAKAAGKKKK